MPMTRSLVFKHLRIDKNGTRKYRRRVPKELQSALGKQEFVKVLGKTDSEVMRNYTAYHNHVEQLLRSTRPASDASELASVKEGIEAQFTEVGADPFSRGKSEGERIAREEEAERILRRYQPEPETGRPDPDDLSMRDRTWITALLNGLQHIESPLTIKQAFAFYLDEKKEPDPFKRKKQIQRFSRVERELIEVTKQDIPITNVTRSHARQVRDAMIARMRSTSVKRNITSIKSVFNFAIKEYSLNIPNHFSDLDLPKPDDAAIERRYPLPEAVIREMYQDLGNNQTFEDIWTLLHHTGAQSAEILGLQVSDLQLDEPVPYFEIKPSGLRTVKDVSRIRYVPLVGKALQVAHRLSETTQIDAALFPKYFSSEKHDSFSNSMNKRIRKYTSNNKHVVYSLRHNMKDYLRPFGPRVEKAIMGHSEGKSVSEVYGSRPSIEELHRALSSIEFSVD